MRIGKFINMSLLNIISEHGEIDYFKLEKIYKKPQPAGVISLQDLMDNDLKDLVEEGRITREGNLIKYIG